MLGLLKLSCLSYLCVKKKKSYLALTRTKCVSLAQAWIKNSWTFFFFFCSSLKIKKSPLGWDQEWKISGHKSNFFPMCSGSGRSGILMEGCVETSVVSPAMLLPCSDPLVKLSSVRAPLPPPGPNEYAECRRDVCDWISATNWNRQKRRWLKLIEASASSKVIFVT